MGFIMFCILFMFFTLYFPFYYHKNILKNVIVKRHFSKNRVYEGEEFDIIYEIENNKWLPIINLYVIDNIPESIKVKTDTDVKNFTSFHINIYGNKVVTRKYFAKAVERDFISTRYLRLIASDMFSVSKTEEIFYTYDNLYIYPKSKKINLDDNFYMDKETKPLRRWLENDPLSFYSVRDYIDTDTIKNINWNKSAQFNKLMVNEYETNKSNQIVLFYYINKSDTKALYNNVQDVFHYLAYLLYIFLKKGYDTSFIINCGNKSNENSYIRKLNIIGSSKIFAFYDLLAKADINYLFDCNKLIKDNLITIKKSKLIVIALNQMDMNNVRAIVNGYGINAKYFIPALTAKKNQVIS